MSSRSNPYHVLVVVVLVAAPALTVAAGLAQADPSPPDVARASHDYTNDDWFLLSTPRAPDGHVRAFEFRIPDGAVQNTQSVPLLYLEVVAVDDTLEPGQDWDLYGFVDDGESLRVVMATYGATLHTTRLDVKPAEVSTQAPRGLAQVFVVPGEDLADGDHLYFVLVGRGHGTDMSFAMRTTEADGRTIPHAAPDFDAFLATEDSRPVVPPRVFDGNGAYKAIFGELLDPDGVSMRAWTDSADHTTKPVGTMTDGATTRRLSVGTTAATGPGWTYALVQHDGDGEAVTWSLEMAAQGHTARANGATASLPLGSIGNAAHAANGAPNAFFLADGDGASHTRLTLTLADGGFGSRTYVHHGWLSASLEEMTGVPSDHFEGIHQGVAGGLPWTGDVLSLGDPVPR